MTDFASYGMSTSMGPKLRQYVEEQLIRDLNNYRAFSDKLYFDWSESCVEGKDAEYLDGRLENFSGIYLLNDKGEIVASGWMEFLLFDEKLIIYWEFLDIQAIKVKSKPGIPVHIWSNLSTDIQAHLKNKRLGNS